LRQANENSESIKNVREPTINTTHTETTPVQQFKSPVGLTSPLPRKPTAPSTARSIRTRPTHAGLSFRSHRTGEASARLLRQTQANYFTSSKPQAPRSSSSCSPPTPWKKTRRRNRRGRSRHRWCACRPAAASSRRCTPSAWSGTGCVCDGCIVLFFTAVRVGRGEGGDTRINGGCYDTI